jgi:hypothetical protein
MIEALRENLRYDPETGQLWWKVREKGRRLARPAGAPNGNGYRRVCVRGVRVLVHRAVWALHHGAWPEREIDHIDGNRLNNRLENLRDVSAAYNHHNVRAERPNKSGVRGVYLRRHRFQAMIRVDGRAVCLGSYATVEEASAAYWTAKRRLHPGWVEA